MLARAITGTALAAPTLTAAETALAVAALPADHDDALTWNVAVMELGALVYGTSPSLRGLPDPI